jgi:hypothetical protein
MQAINNFVGSLFSNSDNFVTAILENRYFFITIVIITLLYGSLNTSRLTSNILSLFDNPLTRLTMIGFIYYISTKNVPLAILMLAATITTMNSQNRQRLNYVMISLFRGKLLTSRRCRMRRMSKRRQSRRRQSRRQSKRRKSKRRYSKRSYSIRRRYKLLKKIRKERILRKLEQVLDRIGVLLNKRHSRKLPKRLIRLAVKAKEIAKLGGVPTPKIVKQITSKLIPVEIINGLLKKKKISADDARKLKELNSKTLLNLLKSTDGKKLTIKVQQQIPTKIESSPKSVSSQITSSPKSVSSQITSSSKSVSSQMTLSPKSSELSVVKTITPSSNMNIPVISPKGVKSTAEKYTNYFKLF